MTKKTPTKKLPAPEEFEAQHEAERALRRAMFATGARFLTEFPTMLRAQTAESLARALESLRGEHGSPAVEMIRTTLLGELHLVSLAMAAERVAPKPNGATS